jgi:hypothetical protein
MLRSSPLAVPAVLLFAACTLKGDIGELSQGDSSGAGTEDPSATDGATDPMTTGVTEIMDDDTTDGTTGAPELTPATGVDILFVIDNSGSMADHQQRLANAIPALVGPLTAAGLDLRIAVTTTDAGNPRCPAATFKPEAGAFQDRTCRAAVAEGEWVFNGEDSSAACLDQCPHETITFAPTATAADPEPKPRPWIEWNDGAGNIDVPLNEALACVLPQGVAGCGFESTLEAMYLALARTQTAGEASFGFLRTDADLLVVIVTDETDCSGNPEHSDIFTSNKVFWTNPDDPAPTSALCWKAGMQCTGGPGVYDDCVAVDRDGTGEVTNDPSAAVLQPLSRYQGVGGGVGARQSAPRAAATVHVAAITGVPVGYPGVPLVFQDSPDQDIQNNFGIAPGCVNDGVMAVPPGRVREVVEGTAPLGPGLFSICDPSFDGSLGILAEGLIDE